MRSERGTAGKRLLGHFLKMKRFFFKLTQWGGEWAGPYLNSLFLVGSCVQGNLAFNEAVPREVAFYWLRKYE